VPAVRRRNRFRSRSQGGRGRHFERRITTGVRFRFSFPGEGPAEDTITPGRYWLILRPSAAERRNWPWKAAVC